MKIKIISAFFLLYIISLLITLPASMVTGFIPAQAGVKVSNPSGSLWDGKASQVSYNKYQLKKFSWKIDWSALFSLQLKLDIKFNNGNTEMSGKGSVLAGFSGLAVENLLIDSSASEILSYIKLPVPIKATGDITLQVKQGSQGEPYCQELDGRISWQDAEINSDMGKIDLASVDIDLGCDKGQISADLKQQSEQLHTTANALLKEHQAYQLNGLIKATNKLNPTFKQGLSWIGGKDSSGATILKFNGKL
ncbi:type II secretion system protein N [Psychromonas ossibalaenae]|uniref:type II secretion system protein N n=1 Tax=Psychromonas ossibalaenae TaxID=444922 RepID=UPI00035F7CA0|nr:type II secretion system protein N [Psychromonas ossibalaenae]